MRRSLGFLLASVLLCTVAPVRASHLGLPIVHEFTNASGGSWAAYRFTTQPGVTVEWQSSPTLLDSRAYGGGAWLLNADGSLATYFLTTGYSGITNETHVEGPEPIGVIADTHNDGMFGQGGVSGGWQFNVAKEFVLVTTAAGDGLLRSTLTLAASPEVEILNVTSGTDTFMRVDSDFGGGVNVIAGGCVQRFVGCGKGKAIANGSASASAADRLFAAFSSYDTLTVLSVDGPQSAGRPGLGSAVLSNEQPGSYAFNVEANVGAVFTGLSAWGADVLMP